MNFHLVLRVLGILLIISGLAMFVPVGVAAFFKDGGGLALVASILVNLLTGLVLLYSTRKISGDLRHREGFAIVSMGWLVLGCFGSLPYLFSGTLNSPIDAVFETMSGYTTTGATVIQDIEALPHAILIWRSMTQWFGGMGVLLLTVAILPFLGVGGMQLFRAEVTGPVKDRLTPRITSTAKFLWGVYLSLTLTEALLLRIGGMSFFEAINHSFTTVATGGFSTVNGSIADFNSLYIELVILSFMFLAGVNFALHYRFIFKQDFKGVHRDEEFRFYLLLTFCAIGLITFDLLIHRGYELGQGIRDSAFTVVSIMTTTGFCTADFDKWPSFSKFLLITLMFIGGCAGSTGGGMKQLRVLILIKHGIREIRRLIFPGAVFPVKINGQAVSNDVVTNVLGFFLLFILVFVVATFLVALQGVEFITSFTSVAATLGNIGPGFSLVGATQNYAHLPAMVKVILTVCMLIGRLEIYTVLVLFIPRFWKK